MFVNRHSPSKLNEQLARAIVQRGNQWIALNADDVARVIAARSNEDRAGEPAESSPRIAV